MAAGGRRRESGSDQPLTRYDPVVLEADGSAAGAHAQERPAGTTDRLTFRPILTLSRCVPATEIVGVWFAFQGTNGHLWVVSPSLGQGGDQGITIKSGTSPAVPGS